MAQENEANLESFEEAFPLFKVEVDAKRITVPSDNDNENPTILSICPSHTYQLHQPAEGEYDPAGTGLC